MIPRADNLLYPLQQSKAADLKTQSSNVRVKINHREETETKKSTCYNFSCVWQHFHVCNCNILLRLISQTFRKKN